MALPKLTTPEFYTKLPSTDQTVAFRPFLVKEEKILLMAQQGQDQQEVKNTIFRILESCLMTPIDVKNLPTYDIEWLFLQLRSKSIGEVIELKLKHYQNPDCNAPNDVQINIDDIKINVSKDKSSNIIDLDGNVGIVMRHPSINMVNIKEGQDPTVQDMFQILEECIVNIFDKEQVYNDFTKPELNDFLENLDQKQFGKIIQFFDNTPKVTHDIKYKCAKCGEEVNYTLKGLMDFFL